MPVIRKVPADVAARWHEEDEPIPVPTNRRGLSRMDFAKSRSFGWMARVYHDGKTVTRYFADGAHGGPSGALRAAEAWLTEQHQRYPLASRSYPDGTYRLARSDNSLVGWFAYVWAHGRRQRRYFSDSAHGGFEAARQAAEAWAHAQIGEQTANDITPQDRFAVN
jgi:hypothetical protein